MEDNTINKVTEIVEGFDNSKIEEIKHIEAKDYLTIINETIINFFEARINNIAQSENLATLVDKELEEDVKSKSLSFDQKLRLRNSIKEDANIGSESILSLLKTNQGSNKLLDNLTEKSKDASDKGKEFFDNMGKDDIETMSKFVQVIKYLVQEKTDTTEK